MTEIAEVNTTTADEQSGGRKRKGSGLDSMVLPELKQLASSLGLRGTGGMRKGQLIEAIRSAQNGSGAPAIEQARRQRRPTERLVESGRTARRMRRRPPALPIATRPPSSSRRERRTGRIDLASRRPGTERAGRRRADGELTLGTGR